MAGHIRVEASAPTAGISIDLGDQTGLAEAHIVVNPNIGAGAPASADLTHSYSDAGTFTVTVIVTTPSGVTVNATAPIQVVP
jgi:hypothetical protein